MSSDMNRPPTFGSSIVTGPASRSNTPNEYSVSRFMRMTSWASIATGARWCPRQPNAPSRTALAKYMCDSARWKLTTVTGTVGAERAFARRTFVARRADARFLGARLVGVFDRDFIGAPLDRVCEDKELHRSPPWAVRATSRVLCSPT